MPVEPAPEVALPGPSMRQLKAAEAAAQDAATLQAAKDFFASSRPVAVNGIPRFRKYEAETKQLLALVEKYGMDIDELPRMQCPLASQFESALNDVHGILRSPQVTQTSLDKIDAFTAKDCEVSREERAAGLTLPEHFHGLRNALHRVGPGDDRIRETLTRLRDLLPRITAWVGGEIARRRHGAQE